MGKITLREKLLLDGKLNRNIIVSSNFIKEMEVYGFMNCKGRENILSGSGLNGLTEYGDVQVNSSDCIVYSFFMRQNNVVTPIYHTIAVCSQDSDINIEELHIPSFSDITIVNNSIMRITDKLYREIKSRYGTGKIVSEKEWDEAKWSSKYNLVAGKVMMHINQGEIVFKDKHDCIKSVEEEAVALCRFPIGETGDMKYITFGLDQLFINGKTRPSQSKS